MAWARYDDGFHSNKKVMKARSQGLPGFAALGLHVVVNTWCRGQPDGTGFVASYIPEQMAGKHGIHLAKILEDTGLFDPVEGGWIFHDYEQYSPRYNAEQLRENGRKGGRPPKKSVENQDGNQEETKPVSEPEPNWLPDQNQEETKLVSGSEPNPNQTETKKKAPRASARRNPDPEPSEPNGSGGQAAAIGPNEIVAAWVDAFTGNDVKPSVGMKGQVAKLSAELIKAGNDPRRVLAAAQQAGAKGYATIDRELGAMNGRATVTPIRTQRRDDNESWMNRRPT